MPLSLEANIENPDAFYEALTDAQREMTDGEANDMNARLVLILANQVGRLDDLREAIALARGGATADRSAQSSLAPAVKDFVAAT